MGRPQTLSTEEVGRKARERQKAQHRARQRVIDEHWDDYQRYYQEELSNADVHDHPWHSSDDGSPREG